MNLAHTVAVDPGIAWIKDETRLSTYRRTPRHACPRGPLVGQCSLQWCMRRRDP